MKTLAENNGENGIINRKWRNVWKNMAMKIIMAMANENNGNENNAL
jgi:hypothetical protein